MIRDYSNLDGELIDYEVLGGGSDVKKNYREEFFADANGSDSAMFYGVDNDCPGNYSNALGDPYASFMNLPSFKNTDSNYSNAGGLISGTILDKKERARRRSLREDTKKQRQERKDVKVGAKQTTAEGQKAAAESLGKESQSDIALAQALSQKSSDAPKGLSTGAKVGIALGVLAVLGVGIYFVMKKKSAVAVAPTT